MVVPAPTYQQLRKLCKNNGFSCRGKVFFRVQGDGVLQVLKYECKRYPFYSERVWFGLFSMYGDLLPQWFTSGGAIPSYDTRYLARSRREREPAWSPQMTITSLEDQEDFVVFHLDLVEFEQMILPYLNTIQTQEQLCDGIMFADIQEMNTVKWNDRLKMDAFAAAGDYASAEKAVGAILNQHDIPTDSVEKLVQSYPTLSEENQELVDLFLMFVRRNKGEVEAYLQGNYEKNCEYARFCMPR